MIRATRRIARPLRFDDRVSRGLLSLLGLGGGHPALIALILPAGLRVLLPLGADAAGLFPVFVGGREGAAGVFPVEVLVSAAPTAAPAAAPAAPAAATLPELRFEVEDGGVAGVDGGSATPTVAEGGKTFVVFPVLLGMGGAAPRTMGAGSAGVRAGVPGVFLLPVSVPIAAGVEGTFAGVGRPCAGGRSTSKSSIFEPEPAP